MDERHGRGHPASATGIPERDHEAETGQEAAAQEPVQSSLTGYPETPGATACGNTAENLGLRRCVGVGNGTVQRIKDEMAAA